MRQLGVHFLFIRFPDGVHCQEKRSVRRIAHYVRIRRRMNAPDGAGNRRHQPCRIDKRKDNGDESLQTVATQNTVARDNRGCDDASRLDAVLQGTGSKSSDFYGYGRRRRLPSEEAANKEAREGTERNPLYSGRTLQAGNRSKAEYPSSRS
jgi:hypothetical protein